MSDTLTVQTTVDVPKSKTWTYYTEAEHVINWNFVSEEWHCPSATNDLRVGGKFEIVMAEKEGNMEVELEGTYQEVEPEKHVVYTLGNDTKVNVRFKGEGDKTNVTVEFEPNEHEKRDQQQQNWKGILKNFKQYAEQQAKA